VSWKFIQWAMNDDSNKVWFSSHPCFRVVRQCNFKLLFRLCMNTEPKKPMKSGEIWLFCAHVKKNLRFLDLRQTLAGPLLYSLVLQCNVYRIIDAKMLLVRRKISLIHGPSLEIHTYTGDRERARVRPTHGPASAIFEQ
jgi:hypothetical protein